VPVAGEAGDLLLLRRECVAVLDAPPAAVLTSASRVGYMARAEPAPWCAPASGF
jgi:hypothetical protein